MRPRPFPPTPRRRLQLTGGRAVEDAEVVGPRAAVVGGGAIVPHHHHFLGALEAADGAHMALAAILLSPLPVRAPDHPGSDSLHHHPVVPRAAHPGDASRTRAPRRLEGARSPQAAKGDLARDGCLGCGEGGHRPRVPVRRRREGGGGEGINPDATVSRAGRGPSDGPGNVTGAMGFDGREPPANSSRFLPSFLRTHAPAALPDPRRAPARTPQRQATASPARLPLHPGTTVATTAAPGRRRRPPAPTSPRCARTRAPALLRSRRATRPDPGGRPRAPSAETAWRRRFFEPGLLQLEWEEAEERLGLYLTLMAELPRGSTSLVVLLVGAVAVETSEGRGLASAGAEMILGQKQGECAWAALCGGSLPKPNCILSGVAQGSLGKPVLYFSRFLVTFMP